MKNYKMFNVKMITTQSQLMAYKKLINICQHGRGTDGIEDATIELLQLIPTADYIGFIVYNNIMEICESPNNIEIAIQNDGIDPHEIAELICLARGIEPEFNGGQSTGYIHINKGSRRSREGYTLGYCF